MSLGTLLRNKLFLGLLVFGAVLAVGTLRATPAAAYSGGRLIDNAVFRDSSSMTANQIQSFLESKNSGLKSKTYELECYGANSQERKLYKQAGAKCSGKIKASSIIYYAAKIYGVNPRVVLATLQKEQSLITTTNPTKWQLSQAMGYGCPTTGSCDSESNFAYQIDSGTWVLRYHYERANKNNTWWRPSDGWTCGTKKNFYTPNLYPRQNVTFKDGNGVSYRTHYIDNAATSAFYCYTPHAYNNPNGLYGLPKYGTKGQYYTGSYNFVSSFEKWFGSTLGGVQLIRSEGSSTVYLVHSDSKIRVANDDAFNAWGFGDYPLSTLGSEALASYSTKPEVLGRLAIPATGKYVYFVDSKQRHKVHSSQIATAWGLNTSNVPKVGSTTTNTLKKYESLTYLARKGTGPATYLIENGRKLPIASLSAFYMIQGSDQSPKVRSFSDTTMNSLETGPLIGYSFKVGSQWYVFDKAKLRKVNSEYVSRLNLTGPTLSSNILKFFPLTSMELKDVFRYGKKYYRIKPSGALESTTSQTTAATWKARSAPILGYRLFNEIR